MITAEFDSERILKIGQHWPKLWAIKYRVVAFIKHRVLCWAGTGDKTNTHTVTPETVQAQAARKWSRYILSGPVQAFRFLEQVYSFHPRACTVHRPRQPGNGAGIFFPPQSPYRPRQPGNGAGIFFPPQSPYRPRQPLENLA